MHSLCCTSPLKSQYLCFPFNLAIYLGSFNRNYQASQLKHGNSGMLNLKSAVPKPSISAAIWGLHFFKKKKSVFWQNLSKNTTQVRVLWVVLFRQQCIQIITIYPIPSYWDCIDLSCCWRTDCVQIPNCLSKQDQRSNKWVERPNFHPSEWIFHLPE